MVALSRLQSVLSYIAPLALDPNAASPSSPGVYPSPQGGRTSADQQWDLAYARAREFVSQLSLAEKVNLTSGIDNMGKCVGNTADLPDRENMWGLCLQDGPTGVRKTDFVTGMPPGISVAATFNEDLFLARGHAIGEQYYLKGVDICLGPTVGPMGVKPLGGRQFESFGSDPYLQGVAGALTVEGIQAEGVMANGKHFIANEQETDRFTVSENFGDRALHELYAWPFANMIRAGVGSVMCSYNRLNNTWGCENSYTLNKVLKDELGFQGFVMSDWGATHSGVRAVTSGLDMDMPGQGFFGASLTKAVLNGTIPMERINDMATRVMAAFFKDKLDESRAARGGPNFSSHTLDDKDYLYSPVKYGPIVTVNEHVEARTGENYLTSYQTALESVVLVKNEDNALPLVGDKKPRKIGVFGAAAKTNTEGHSCDLDGGCRGNLDGAAQLGWGSAGFNYPYFVSPLEGLNEIASRNGIVVDSVLYETSAKSASFGKVAAASDVNIIYALASSGEGSDRDSYNLWFNADQTILDAAALNRNNIVVINTAGVVDMEKWIDHENVTAVILAMPGGQDTGSVLADVVFGAYNPSGRLPFTIARDISHYWQPVSGKPDANGVPQDNEIGDADIFLDYRHFDRYDITPRYEFGYGLSYTTFKFDNLHIQKVQDLTRDLPPPPPLRPLHKEDSAVPDPADLLFPDGFDKVPKFQYPYIDSVYDGKPHDEKYPFPAEYSTNHKNVSSLAGGASGGNPALWDVAYRITVQISNTGNLPGKHVGQLYVGIPDSKEYPVPPKQLRGFVKPYLSPGERQTLSFDLLRRDLSVWDVHSASWIVLPGEYKVWVGSSSRDLETFGTFHIS